MVEQVLDRARKRADLVEVYSEETTELEVSFEAGSLKHAERKTTAGIGLRVIHNGRLGCASTTDPTRVDDLIDRALAAARFGKEVTFTFPGAMAIPPVETYDPNVESFTPERAVTEGKHAVERLKELCPAGLTDTSCSAATTKVRLVNSAGLDYSYRATDFSQAITLILVKGDSILWFSDGGDYGTCTLRTDAYVDHIAELEGYARKKVPRTTGRLPVIMVADELGNLTEALELATNGKRLFKGDSPLIGKEGQRVLGGITITDDPLLPFAPSSRSFDDEGVVSQKTVLFRDGVFESFLFDLDTAARTGRRSTGSASRGSLASAEIDTSNLVITPGQSTLASMIADMKHGVIVHDVLGGGQSNLLAGDFALNVMLGFLIRDGEIVGRVTDTMMSGNVYDAFNDVTAMGSELKPSGSLFAPDITFAGLTLTGS